MDRRSFFLAAAGVAAGPPPDKRAGAEIAAVQGPGSVVRQQMDLYVGGVRIGSIDESALLSFDGDIHVVEHVPSGA